MGRLIGIAVRLNRVQQNSLALSRRCHSNSSVAVFDEKVLQYLVCPISKQKLRYDSKNSMLICDELQVAYPIENGIPNLIPNSAIPITEVKSGVETDASTSQEKI